MRIRTLKDFKLKGKKVLFRLDYNVPLEKSESGEWIVTDDTRIRESLPTLQYAIEQGAKIIIASHCGRPKGKPNADHSLAPAAEKLAELLGKDVTLADDCVGEGIELKAASLKEGEVLMLENLRFHPEEEAGDLEFSQKLARISDIYINDAFGTSHREHASTYRLPSIHQNIGMGLLIEKEVQTFERLLHTPERPFFLILGGSKVSDKIQTILSLMKRVQGIAIGGAMAYAFMKARGEKIEAEWKQPAPEDVEAAKKILKEANIKGLPVQLPIDTNHGFDIGPKSIAAFKEFLTPAKTIFWNGPLGWFEKPEYSTGTFQIAEHLSTLEGCFKSVGGGDTVAAIHASGFSSHFQHLSTGGGAALEYLEKEGLPGIEVLKQIGHRPESPDLE